MPQLPKNITTFISSTAKKLGDLKKDDFEYSFLEYTDFEIIKSPIEILLYCALSAVLDYAKLEQPAVLYQPGDEDKYLSDDLNGIIIEPQYKIGKYRCDFFISYYATLSPTNSGSNFNKNILVECDSQEFHERSEKERRYEKARDRYFISKGYQVFHYTGKEIIKNSFMIACEIINFVTLYDINWKVFK